MQRQQAATVLRWIAVLPAAIAAQLVVKYAGGLIGRLVRDSFGSESNITLPLQMFFYAGAAAAFVLAGALTAPSHRRFVALTLAAAAAALSLLTHILSQQHPGITNSLHLAAETVGAAAAAAFVLYGHKRPA